MIVLEQKYLLNFKTVSDIFDHPVYQITLLKLITTRKPPVTFLTLQYFPLLRITGS